MRGTTARSQLLVSILAALGVSAVACKSSVVTPDAPGDDPKECPSSKGFYAVWPGDKPDFGAGMNEVCLPKPENGKCETHKNACVLKAYVCGLHHGGEAVLGTLPSSNPEACCWKVKGDCAVGRPFVVEGVTRVAPLESGDGWLASRDLEARLVPAEEVRAALADVWARDGLTEHASVASFAKLVLELLALGAPAHLVRGAQEAMADEIRHAERAFAMASRYAGAPVGPGALDIRGVAASAPTLADFAARAASEGCIAETIAALQLHASADAAFDPAVAHELRLTAEEESTHATLAYRIVAWAIAKGGEDVRVAVASVFANAADHVGFGAGVDVALDLRDHGVLSRRERHDLAVTALHEVVVPAGHALLGGRPLAKRAGGAPIRDVG